MRNSDPRADTVDRTKPVNIGFAASHVLPGENLEEFVKLCAGLALRYGAEGELEADAILTMAHALWRKQHLSIFRLAAEARTRYGHFFQFPNDNAGFMRFTSAGVDKLALAAQALAEEYDKRKDSESKQSESYEPKQSEEDDNQIVNRIRQDAFRFDPRLLGTEQMRMSAMEQLTQRMVTAMSEFLGCDIQEEWRQSGEGSDPLLPLALLGDLLTPECLTAELDMIERLDDTIDRSYNRLKKLQAARSKSVPLSVSPLLQHRKVLRRS